MEKIPAACAMEWSIQLEKALRSKVPGRAVKAISQAGHRLEQWNLEPEPTMSAYSLYGLVPGEVRLFANAILIRLVDAFVTGERHIRLAVVQAFLGFSKCERKRRMRMRGSKIKDGILSKGQVNNSTELLRRVKVVFDGGDVETRAMALILFGCWADLAKESAHIRYLILSSIVSSDVSVVKAALFASGCFCELSSDFAYVVLEMLVNLVTSPNVPVTARWAGVRVFSRMDCSYAIADKAYKTGRKLVSESSDDSFLVRMLISLSRIANTMSLLASEQVNFLCSFLGDGKPLHLQETTLRCLKHIIRRGVCHFPERECFSPLLRIVDDPELPATMQCEAVSILHQILMFMLPDVSCIDMLEFDKLLTCLLTASQCPADSKSVSAIHCLADLCTRVGEGRNVGFPGVSPSMSLQVASLLIDRIILLVRPLSDVIEVDSKIIIEVQTELTCLLRLVGKHLNLGLVVLDKFNLLIRHLISDRESTVPSPPEGLSKEKNATIGSKVMLVLYKCLMACLDIWDESDDVTAHIFEKVKILVKGLCDCKLFTFHIQTVYSLLLHSRVIWSGMLRDDKMDENLAFDYRIESELWTLMCTQKMLAGEGPWLAYKSGILAASHGAWFTTTYIFGNLMTKVRSHSCCRWLASLAQLSLCEMRIQLLVLPNQESRLLECLKLIKLLPVSLLEDGVDDVGKCIGSHTATDYAEKLHGAYKYLNSSRESMKSCSTSVGAFCFQAWFLSSRLKMLGTVIEVVGILAETSVSAAECFESLQKLTQLSARLKRLSEEFDLIAASFIDIDRRSLKIIYSLALGCSLLSLAAGFAHFVPNFPHCEILASPQENISQAELVQNLFGQLCLTDHETSANLSSLSNVEGCRDRCHHSHYGSRGLSVGSEDREVVTLCRRIISTVVNLQNEVKEGREEELAFQVTGHGRKLLLDSTMALMRIPFRIPDYFFRTRPCMGSELFAGNADPKLNSQMQVPQGSCLSLNVCIQLKNVPINLLVQPIKLHCIICCNPSFQEPSEPGSTLLRCASRSWETDDMLILNEELQKYVTRRAKKIDGSHAGCLSDGAVARAFVSLEANPRGQGFSNCLLDVSRFPTGTYRTRWHSCCVDGRGSYWSLIPLNSGPVITIM